jgi:hypothetical protein
MKKVLVVLGLIGMAVGGILLAGGNDLGMYVFLGGFACLFIGDKALALGE